MNKTEFRIDEVIFYNNKKHYYIYKKFNIFGFPIWKLYDTNMNNGQFVSFDEAEYWLKEHINQKNTVPYITNQKFITI